MWSPVSWEVRGRKLGWTFCITRSKSSTPNEGVVVSRRAGWIWELGLLFTSVCAKPFALSTWPYYLQCTSAEFSACLCTWHMYVQAGKGREVGRSWNCLQNSNWKSVWILWFSWTKELSCFLTVTYCPLLFHILQVAKDARSDVESSSDEEETVPRSKGPHSTVTTNGTSGANGTNGYLTGATSSEEH